jgi:hypothetical protein
MDTKKEESTASIIRRLKDVSKELKSLSGITPKSPDALSTMAGQLDLIARRIFDESKTKEYENL